MASLQDLIIVISEYQFEGYFENENNEEDINNETYKDKILEFINLSSEHYKFSSSGIP
jgi:hypothetical protein